MSEQLFRATRHGDLGAVKKMILTDKVDPNIRKSRGMPLLHYAVQLKRFQIVKFLVLEGNADVNIQDGSGMTITHQATISQTLEILKCLVLEGGADTNMKDNHGQTALHYACSYRRMLDIVKFLVLQGGADITVKNIHGVTPLQRAINNKRHDVQLWLEEYRTTRLVILALCAANKIQRLSSRSPAAKIPCELWRKMAPFLYE